MSVGILIVAHDSIGVSLVATLKTLINELDLKIDVLSVSHDMDADDVLNEARKRLDNVDRGDGVLILTDLFGSTPYNIAVKLLDKPNLLVLTGLNLPILIRIMNYPKLTLNEMAEKAMEGGKEGIIVCKN